MGSPTAADGIAESFDAVIFKFLQDIPPNLLFTGVVGIFFLFLLSARSPPAGRRLN